MNPHRVFFALFLGALLIIGCDATPGPDGEKLVETEGVLSPTTPAETQISTTPSILQPTGMAVTEEPKGYAMTEDEAVALAKKALAQWSGSPIGGMDVILVTRTRWTDGSLGCPQAGMLYPQVVILGYKVLLGAGGEGFEVHVGDGRAVVCAPEAGRDFATPSFDTAAMARLYSLAIQDLAARLNVPLAQIEGVRIEPMRWPDTSLGCPQPGQNYAKVLTAGFRIELLFRGGTYVYHTDMERVILCQKP